MKPAVWAAMVVLACGCGGSLASGVDAGTDGRGGSGGAGSGGAGGAGGGGGGGTGTGGAGGRQCPAPPAAAGGVVHTGDFTIADTAGADEARSFSQVTGTLRVETTFAGALELPNLRTIDGALAVESITDTSTLPGTLIESQVTALALPNVTRIGGDLWLYLALALREVDLQSLETIGGRAYLGRDPMLKNLRLDALRTVGGELLIQDTKLIDCQVVPLATQVTADSYAITITPPPPLCACHGVACGRADLQCD